MPHIVQTATTRLNITANSLLWILYKINVAQSALRAAGVTELPEICLSPAVKLIRSVRMLEANRIEVPKMISITVPATGLTELPTEILRSIFQTVFEDVRDAVNDCDIYETYEYEIPSIEAYKPVRFLTSAEQAFGIHSDLHAIVRSVSVPIFQEMHFNWSALANVLGYGRRFFIDNYIMGGNELCCSLWRCAEKFSSNDQLRDHTLRQFLDNVTLAIGFDITAFGYPEPDFFLMTEGSNLRLHRLYDKYDDIDCRIEDLLPFLGLIKKAFVMTALVVVPYSDATEKHLVMSEDSPVNLKSVTDFALVDSLLPALESLTVCVSIDVDYTGMHSQAQTLVTKAVKTLRTLPTKRKTILTSETSRSYCTWHPDKMLPVGTAEMTDEEIANGLLSDEKGSGYAFVISEE